MTKQSQMVCSVIAVFVMVFFVSESSDAQERRGTAGAAHLRIVPTAHVASLGSAATAGIPGLSGVEMMLSNPAGLTANRGTGVLFGRMEYLLDIPVNTLVLATQLGNNQIGMYISSWNIGDIPRQTESNPEISELTFSSQLTTVAGTYARSFTDRISAGLTVKLVREDIDDMGASAVAFDGGLAYEVVGSGFRFGFSVRNIGSKLTYSGTGLARDVDFSGQNLGDFFDTTTLYYASEPVDLPALLDVGISYTRPIGASLGLSAVANFRSNAFDQDHYAAGLEVAFVDAFFIRGGFEFMSDSDLTLFQPATFGAGLALDVSGLGVKFDYAYRPTDFFSDVQLFTLDVSI